MLFDKYFMNKADSILKEKMLELQKENEELNNKLLVLESTKGEYVEKSKQLLQSIQAKEKELSELIELKKSEMSILKQKKEEYISLVDGYKNFKVTF